MVAIAAVIPLVVAAHGTRSAAGLATVREVLAAARTRRPDVAILESYLDVASPSLTSVVAALDGPAVVVPFLLSGGYHVRSDIPAVLDGRRDVTVTPPLGPDPVLARVLAAGLADAGGDRSSSGDVVLAWAGSSDPAAVSDAQEAARLLGVELSRPVRPLALSGPARETSVPADVRVASYLLSPGEFAERAVGLGGEVTSGPIGAHPDVVGLLLSRYDSVAGGR